MKDQALGSKKIFGLLLPNWVDEATLRQLVFTFLGLVIAVFMSMMFVWPRLADLVRLEKEYSRLEKKRDSLRAAMENIQLAEAELGESEVEALSLAVPNSFDPGMILIGLRRVSLRAGVNLEAYQVGKGEVVVQEEETVDTKNIDKKNAGDKFLKPHRVTIRLVGQSDKLVNFIDLLGESLPVGIISKLSLSEVSRLFTNQALTQLEMEITYFEAQNIDVVLAQVKQLSKNNLDLLGRVVGYDKPIIGAGFSTGDAITTGGNRNIFGL